MTRTACVAAGCAGVALAVAVVLIGSGEYPMSPAEVLRTLAGHGGPAETVIVDQLRLPQAAAGLLSGAALGLSGAIFQSLLRNPLGSPDLLGFTQGGATGALSVIVAGGGPELVAAGAVTGGLAAGAVIYLLAWRHGLHSQRVILVGIGAAATLTGVNDYLLTHTRLSAAAQAVVWLTGSLDGANWSTAFPLAGALAVALPLVLLASRGLRVLELGDEAAAGLGVHVQCLRFTLLAAAVILAAFAAGAVGPVAFVGLTAPQLARRLTRAPGPGLMPSLLMGAALMVCADLAGQRLIPARQLPAGVMTGILGGAFLIWLLVLQRPAGRSRASRI